LMVKIWKENWRSKARLINKKIRELLESLLPVLDFLHNQPQPVIHRDIMEIVATIRVYKFTQKFIIWREKFSMSTLEQIEAAILTLPSNDFQQLRKWFADLDYLHWDNQLEQDIAEGKLEALAEEAIADFKAGHCREL
jgi:serine/threonine protein kinase